MTDLHNVADETALSLDSMLGPARGRYFGDGYKEVRHALTGAIRFDGPDAEATACVSYPPQWSLDAAGMAKEPHLSSIDAVVLPLLILDRLGTPPSAWVAQMHLRAGSTPWTDLDQVPVLLSADEREDLTALQTFRARTGNVCTFMKISSVEPITFRNGARGQTNVYEALYRSTQSKTDIIGYDEGAGTLHARHHFATDAVCPENTRSGFEASYWPGLTVVDHFATMGQMAQAIVELRHGVGRAGNLWMRRVSITLDDAPMPLPGRMESSMTITRDRFIERSGRRYRDIAVESSSSAGVRVIALLAHEDVT